MENELDTQNDGQHLEDETADNKQTLSFDEALDALKKARNEAAEHRIAKKKAIEERDQFKNQTEELTSKLNEFEAQMKQFADYEEIKSGYSKLQVENKQLGIKVHLAGKVIDVDKALRLVDDSYITVEGQFDTEKFLTENSFLAAKTNITNPASNKGNSNKTDDLSNKSRAELEKFFTDYKPAN